MKASDLLEVLNLKNRRVQIFGGSSRIPAYLLRLSEPLITKEDLSTNGNRLDELSAEEFEFLKKHCEINELSLNNFYYIDNQIYYDDLYLRILNHSITYTVKALSEETAPVFKQLKKQINTLKSDLENKNFIGYLDSFYDQSIIGIEKLLGFENAGEITLTLEEKEVLFIEFIKGFQKINHGFEHTNLFFDSLYNENYQSVIDSKKALKELASEDGYIKVYRGGTDDSRNVEEALSWSLSIDVAASFAYRVYKNHGNYYLYEAKVHIDDCYLFVNDKFNILNAIELEVLIKPNSVRIERTHVVPNVHQITFLLNDVNLPDSDKTFLRLFHDTKDILSAVIQEYENTYRESFFQCSDLHGKTHTHRVLLNALVIAMLNFEYFELTEEDIKILSLAALFHDVGRVHDEEDLLHGQQSVDKMRKFFPDLLSYHISEEDVHIVEFLMANHNLPDDMAYHNLGLNNKLLFNGDINRTWLLYLMLCDADGLDRVRLGDLDISYLRLGKSKILVPFAEDALSFVK